MTTRRKRIIERFLMAPSIRRAQRSGREGRSIFGGAINDGALGWGCGWAWGGGVLWGSERGGGWGRRRGRGQVR